MNDLDTIRSLRPADEPFPKEWSDITLRKVRIMPPARTRRGLQRRLLTAVAVAATLTAAVGVPSLMSADGRERATTTQTNDDLIRYSSAAVQAAERNPRFLIDVPGWQITEVYGFTNAEDGSITFSSGDRTLEMSWYDASDYDLYFNERSIESTDQSGLTVADIPATIFPYSDHDFAVMLEPHGESFVEYRTSGAGWNRQNTMNIVESIRGVDVETWLGAMPPEVVIPAEARAVVAEIMSDIPRPESFDEASLKELGVNSRFNLGVQVTKVITCSWIQTWQAAKSAGHQAAADRAVTAMASSREWDILNEMYAAGQRGWPKAVWDEADRMRSDPSTEEFGDCSRDS